METTSNPFDNESTFLSGETRREQWRKKGIDRRKNRKYNNEDPDIQAEIDKHGSDNVHIIQ